MIFKFLKGCGYTNIINGGLYVAAEGDLPICLCAHMDTVYKVAPVDVYYDSEQKVFWSPQGLGADDRAGIYIILSLIEKGYKPSVIFTDLEEVGGIGAKTLVSKYPRCPFRDCRALIQLDRQGSVDAVYYDCANEDFELLITGYGFITDRGTFSDISILAPEWRIAAVNLSVGYYDEHRETEILKLEECIDTLNKVECMLKDCINWPGYTYIQKEYKYDYPTEDDDFWKRILEDEDNDDEPVYDWLFDTSCYCCGKSITLDESILLQSHDKTEDFYVCPECYETISKRQNAKDNAPN